MNHLATGRSKAASTGAEGATGSVVRSIGVNLENKSLITSTYLEPSALIGDTGPNISKATLSKGDPGT